jgi:hypothetical protein
MQEASAGSGEDRRMSRFTLSALASLLLALPIHADSPAEAEGDALFKAGNHREAAAWYAGVHAADAMVLSVKQREAWAFSRIRIAAESASDPAACEREVSAAVALAPGSDAVKRLGESVLALTRRTEAVNVEATAGENFTVTGGTPEFAEKVAAAAEKLRGTIFERWSGPAGGAWTPKCEIVIHATAAEYAIATKQAAERAGHATVKLAEGKVMERRLDLRADDESLLTDTLPRELTHVILADLFPFTPPPKWAEEGMAVLAASPDEVGRYSRTMAKCAREGKLYTVAALLEMKEFPAAEKITGFHCGSVSLVEYLVKLKGEKHFTTFLRDCQRYGSVSALKRQYGVESPKDLQEAWLKAALK